jgi:hypothetical protein
VKRPLLALSASLVALAACRAVLGIDDLAVEAAADGATPSQDAERDAPAAVDAPDGPDDAPGTDAADAATGCGSRTRPACLACCSALHLAQSNAVYGAEQPCACDPGRGGCSAVCPIYCVSPAQDTAACTDCAARNLVDGGACTSQRASGPDFARCLDTCPVN